MQDLYGICLLRIRMSSYSSCDLRSCLTHRQLRSSQSPAPEISNAHRVKVNLLDSPYY